MKHAFDFTDRCVWITGASSGIGAALAELLSNVGAGTLILSGRSRERLENTAERCRRLSRQRYDREHDRHTHHYAHDGTRDGAIDVSLEVLPFDVADPEQRIRAVQLLQERDLIPDVLINNAGVSQRGLATDTGLSVDRDIMEIDYFAAVDLTKAVLPAMVDRGDGLIVAVSSVAGLIPAPLRSGYNAAKSAQIAFFRTLGNEVARSGVRVCTVIPGFVRTGISENALNGSGSAWGRMDPNQAGGITPERAAREILRGIRRGGAVVWTGIPPRLRLALFLRRFAPGILDRILQKAEVT